MNSKISVYRYRITEFPITTVALVGGIESGIHRGIDRLFHRSSGIAPLMIEIHETMANGWKQTQHEQTLSKIEIFIANPIFQRVEQ
jgi:hypothetical protein